MLFHSERRRKRDSWGFGSMKSSIAFRGSPKSAKKRRRKSLGDAIVMLSNNKKNTDKKKQAKDLKVLVSLETLEAMKREAEALLPTSLQALSTAWQESSDVMASHISTNHSSTTLSSKPCNNSAMMDLLGRTSTTSTAIPPHSAVNHQSQLKRVFQGLATEVGSLDKEVSNWQEARSILTNVLALPRQGEPKKLIQLHRQLRHRMQKSYQEDKASLQSYMKQITLAARQRGFISDIEKWSQTSLHIANKEKTAKTNEAETKTSTVALIDNLLECRITEQQRKQLQLKEKQKRQQHAAAIIAKRDAQKFAQSLLRPFTTEEDQLVHKAMHTLGPPDEILVEDEESGDQVIRSSLQTLEPGQWLNDEVIHYFYKVLANRDAELQQQPKNNKTKRCHFFKSFFMTKLLDEGATNSYRYANVKRWSKRVPGKDIFNLEKIFFPINVSGLHWCCAVIFIEKKRIEFFDSMGGSGLHYLEALKRYLMDEWQSKKGGNPLPDADQWKLITGNDRDDVPKQQNTYDCGVFTCMFADFISRDIPLLFSQSHINECRKRIALSILKGVAIQ